MRRLFTLFAVLLCATLSAFAQGDSPYARFGYEGKVLRTPQERQQRMMLVVPNPDTMATVAKVGLDPAQQKYYLFDRQNQILASDTLLATTVSRFLSVDPLAPQYAWYTPYQFAGNKPVQFIDIDGLEEGLNIHLKLAEQGYLKGTVSEKELKENYQQKGVVGVMGATGLLDAFFFKGWLTRTYLAYTFADAIDNSEQSLKARNAGDKQGAENFSNKSKTAYTQFGVGLLFEGAAYGLNQFLRAPAGSSLIRAVEEDGFAVVRDATGREAGRGSIDGNGALTLTIMTKGTGLAKRGGEVLNEIFRYVNTNFDEVTAINGVWREGLLGDNLATFNQLVKQYGEAGAAQRTFTGKIAERLGFKNAKIISREMNKDGTYRGVDVEFSKQ